MCKPDISYSPLRAGIPQQNTSQVDLPTCTCLERMHWLAGSREATGSRVETPSGADFALPCHSVITVRRQRSAAPATRCVTEVCRNVPKWFEYRSGPKCAVFLPVMCQVVRIRVSGSATSFEKGKFPTENSPEIKGSHREISAGKYVTEQKER